MFSLAAAVAASGLVVWDILKDIVTDPTTARERDERTWEWLEDSLPLRGRWLRCLRMLPSVAIILVPVFTGTYAAPGLLIAIAAGIPAALAR